MYPNVIFLGMTMYEICILIGLIALMVAFRYYADKKGFSARFQNFILALTVFTVVTGYLFAILFQAFYDYLESGTFTLSTNTGATFYGGFVGGAASCLAAYFGVGHFLFKDKEHLHRFPNILECGGFCVPLAHAFGRIGCLFAGCCHGGYTDKWYGIYHAASGLKVVPLQLYESIVLFVIFTVLFINALKKNTYTHALSAYLISYAVWRFFIEFFRTDDRGASPISFLSPSQFTAVILFVVGITLLIIMEKCYVKKGNHL